MKRRLLERSWIPRLGCASLVACAVAVGNASAGLAASFVDVLVDRGVFVAAELVSPGDFDVDSAQELDAQVGSFEAQVNAAALIPGGAGSASAGQVSEIDAVSALGFGSAQAAGSSTDPELLGSLLGDSFFALEFELDASMAYVLTGSLTAAASAAGDALAEIGLAEVGGPLLHFAEVLLDGDSAFDFGGTLVPGTRYELRALATATGFLEEVAPSAAGSAGYAFAFRLVPEPSSALLLAVALAGLGLHRSGRA